jgi:hypothetical protein
MSEHPMNERILELLADEALGQISAADAVELRRLMGEAGGSDAEALERAAAAADVAMHEADRLGEVMPADVAARLHLAAEAFCIGKPGVVGRQDQEAFQFPAWRRFAVAAVLAIAAAAAWYAISRPAIKNPAEARLAMLAEPGVVKVAWTDWAVDGKGPEIPGVKGDVVWSDAEQKGYMRFSGLPANDPSKEQYQLWIIDKTRGMGQRISGAIFDGGLGEVVVAIEPQLLVNKAAAFAVTIEQAGGTWVSDMSRRVNIAAVPD